MPAVPLPSFQRAAQKYSCGGPCRTELLLPTEICSSIIHLYRDVSHPVLFSVYPFSIPWVPCLHPHLSPKLVFSVTNLMFPQIQSFPHLTHTFHLQTSMTLSILISCGCYNKLPQTQWLKTIERQSFPALETRSPKISTSRLALVHLQGHCPAGTRASSSSSGGVWPHQSYLCFHGYITFSFSAWLKFLSISIFQECKQLYAEPTPVIQEKMLNLITYTKFYLAFFGTGD